MHVCVYEEVGHVKCHLILLHSFKWYVPSIAPIQKSANGEVEWDRFNHSSCKLQ